MARPGDDVPQTPAEAVSFGWTWIEAKCLGCKHWRQMHLRDLAVYRSGETLATIAARLRCGKCTGREIGYELGTYVTEGRQTFSHRRPIAFELGRAVRVER